jgi:glycosyltransferase involved in cell wall biosynthesis
MITATLPRISIVIPSYNQARYLDEAICSVLNQNYPSLELVVIDGGSNDCSVDVIRKYSDKLAYWVSEEDRGQTHAINKGMTRATSDVVAYLNSDDCLEPGCLERVGRFFAENQTAEWLTGGCRVFGAEIEIWYLHPEGWNSLIDTVLPWARPQKYVFPQSGACFMRRELIERLGDYDETLHYSMDMEYYARAAFAGAKMHVIPDILAGWRWHAEAKSWVRGISYAFRQDELTILKRYVHRLPQSDQERAHRELSVQSQEVVVREAIYRINNGGRLAGLKMLLQLGKRAPQWLIRRRWLGAVRRSFCPWGKT